MPNTNQPPHSIKTAAVFPALLPLSVSLPQSSNAFGTLGSTGQDVQVLEPLVYSYIAAAARVPGEAKTERKGNVNAAIVPMQKRPALSIDTKRAARAQPRSYIE